MKGGKDIRKKGSFASFLKTEGNGQCTDSAPILSKPGRQKMSVTVTALIENQPSGNLKSENGLSLWIDIDGTPLLFDTGLSGTFMDNADALGIPVRSVQEVILSHGHIDHCGGFLRFMKEAESPYTLYLHRDSFKERYWYRDDDGGYYYPTASGLSADFLMRNRVPYRAVAPDRFFELKPGVYLMGNVPRRSPYEPIDETDIAMTHGEFGPDPYTDELTLVLKRAEGLVLFSGCAHLGLINICSCAEELFHMPVIHYIGGTHLLPADDGRILKTVDYINGSSLKTAAVCHCTGENALKCFTEKCASYVPFHTGITLTFA
jgi:7,8-dihydropterin-6-yl-methyl-4-(beta-D-ribofuranosyl)aminobenzene 5'-phosphate synthase